MSLTVAAANQSLDWFADTEVLLPIVLHICEVVYRQYHTRDPTSSPKLWKKKWSKVILKLQIEWGFSVDRLSLKNKTAFIEHRIKYTNGEETRINPLALRRKLNEKYPHTRAIVDDAMGSNVIGRAGRSTPHEQSVIRNLQGMRQLLELLVEHFIHGSRSEVQDALRTLHAEHDSSIRDGGDESGDASNDDSDYEHDGKDDDAMIDDTNANDGNELSENGIDLTQFDMNNNIESISLAAPAQRRLASPVASWTSSSSSSSSSSSPTAASARSGLAAENAKKAAAKAAEVAERKAAVLAAKAANPRSSPPRISADGRSLLTTALTGKSTQLNKRARVAIA
jgi:hypothetical protein